MDGIRGRVQIMIASVSWLRGGWYCRSAARGSSFGLSSLNTMIRSSAPHLNVFMPHNTFVDRLLCLLNAKTWKRSTRRCSMVGRRTLPTSLQSPPGRTSNFIIADYKKTRRDYSVLMIPIYVSRPWFPVQCTKTRGGIQIQMYWEISWWSLEMSKMCYE